MTETRSRRTGIDHEHVERMSARMAMLLAAVAALLLHLLQWILLPFVVSGLLAYVCTPAVDWLTARRRTCPRRGIHVRHPGAPWLVDLPPGCSVAGTRGHEAGEDFQGTVETLAQDLIGSARVNLLGQPMTAEQLVRVATVRACEWIGETGHIVSTGSAAFATTFGAFLTLVLLFYFLLDDRGLACGLLWLAPRGSVH